MVAHTHMTTIDGRCQMARRHAGKTAARRSARARELRLTTAWNGGLYVSMRQRRLPADIYLEHAWKMSRGQRSMSNVLGHHVEKMTNQIVADTAYTI
jgi:hypothetical protein